MTAKHDDTHRPSSKTFNMSAVYMPSSLLPEIASDQSTCLVTESPRCTDVHMRGSLSDIHLLHTLCSVNA